MERTEALKILKDTHNTALFSVRTALETLIPELRESKDERIRNLIYCLIRDRSDNQKLLEHNGVSVDEALAYLEKQKEQTPSTEETELNSIAFLEQLGYTCTPPGKLSTPEDIAAAYQMGLAEGRNEQKPAEKQGYTDLNDMERAIHRGFLAAGVENVPVTIIKETAKECLAQMKSAEWSEEDSNMLHDIEGYVTGTGSSSGITKKERSEWLWNLPRRFNLQPKQEWSEEDEEKITFLERLIRYNVPEGQYGWVDGHKGGFVTKLEAISILKSLRPLPHWKPSEEQMEALKNSAYGTYQNGDGPALRELYEQLKKL